MKTRWWYCFYSPIQLTEHQREVLSRYESEEDFQAATEEACGWKLINTRKLTIKDGVSLVTGEKSPEDFY
jgi:hypothetical protein